MPLEELLRSSHYHQNCEFESIMQVHLHGSRDEELVQIEKTEVTKSEVTLKKLLIRTDFNSSLHEDCATCMKKCSGKAPP